MSQLPAAQAAPRVPLLWGATPNVIYLLPQTGRQLTAAAPHTASPGGPGKECGWYSSPSQDE